MEDNSYKKNLQLSLENQNIILILAGFLVGLVVGIGATYIVGTSTKQASVSQEHEALKAAVRKQYPEYFEQEGLGTFYSGTVEEVKSDSIVIKREIPEIVLLASDLSEFKEIKIDENTQIIKETQKDPEQYNRELAEYEEAYAEYEEQLNNLPEDGAMDAELDIVEPLYPSATEEQEIGVSEIEPGQRISVDIYRDGILAEGEGESEEGVTTTMIRVEEDFTEEMLEEEFPEEEFSEEEQIEEGVFEEEFPEEEPLEEENI